MKFKEIQKLIKVMEKRMDSMNIGIKSYLGIVIGYRTFVASEIHSGNIYLFEDEKIFMPDQNLVERSEKFLIEFKILSRRIKSEEGSSSKKRSKRKMKEFKEMIDRRSEINDKLVKNLNAIEFKTPQFELRFKEIDIEAIQEIKKHPIVQKVGKTDMSLASIRVVIW